VTETGLAELPERDWCAHIRCEQCEGQYGTGDHVETCFCSCHAIGERL
jgi:hypothetical protein